MPRTDPLNGQTVLLTRPAGRSAGLARRLRELGATVAQRPTIAFEGPPDPYRARDAVWRLEHFDWIVFSSATGVESFLEVLEAESPGAVLHRARIAAVGPGTAETLRHAGLAPALVARQSHAEGLAESLRQELASGDRVLWVRPEKARSVLSDALEALGAIVESVVFYRTVPAADAHVVAAEVGRGLFDAVVFTSPSTFRMLLDAAPEIREDVVAGLSRASVIAIGPVTAAALEREGLPPTRVATSPREEAVVAAVLSAIEGGIMPRFEGAPGRGVVAVAERDVNSQTVPRTTPLLAEHEALNARMVTFAGWRMPIQYAGVIEEHLAVRNRVGLFDVSHMGEAFVRGPEALEFLQRVTCNNVARLRPGRAQYSALTTPQGTFVDDLLVYDLGDGAYMLVLNAANTKKDLDWLREHAADFDVRVEDESADWALISLQGPLAPETIRGLTDQPLDALKYYHFVETELAGVRCIVSRTGYTGEYGFEVYGPSGRATMLWQALMEAGRPQEIAPIGLGARDTLRLEARMALYGNDIDDTTTVLEADLGWIVKFKKGEFLGRDVLLRQKEQGVERKLVGFEMQGRAIARPGYDALHDGRIVGRVTSGSHAPYLKRNIGLAYLPVALCEIGTEFGVQVRKRVEPAVVVPTPFYKRPT